MRGRPAARLLLDADQPEVREALTAAGYEVVACTKPVEVRARLGRDRSQHWFST